MPGPVVQLHRAVAVAEVAGTIGRPPGHRWIGLHCYHLFHAIRADFLRRLGRTAEAASAYAAALSFEQNQAERDFLQGRYDEMVRA